MGDGEIGYDMTDDDYDADVCSECGAYRGDENFVWDGECTQCESVMQDREIEWEIDRKLEEDEQ